VCHVCIWELNVANTECCLTVLTRLLLLTWSKNLDPTCRVDWRSVVTACLLQSFCCSIARKLDSCACSASVDRCSLPCEEMRASVGPTLLKALRSFGNVSVEAGSQHVSIDTAI
jgi:hypothetical protein